MTHHREGESKAPAAQDEVRRGVDDDASFVRGISPALLQRKIQRRATERRATGPHASAAEGDTTTAAGDTAAAGDAYSGAGEKEDPNVVELKTKVGRLVTEKFAGDYKKAFAHYDTDHSGGIDKNELTQLLKDAGVGNGLTRGAWAKGIIEKMDTNKDGRIQWSEFEQGIHG